MAETTKIIQLGVPFLDVKEAFQPQFDFIEIANDDTYPTIQIRGQQLFEEGHFNNHFRNDLFLVTNDSFLNSVNQEYIEQLPANQVLVDDSINVSDTIQPLFELKNFQTIKTSDTEQFVEKVKKTYFTGQWGDKFGFDKLSISPSFDGEINQVGHNYLEVQGNSSSEFQTVFSWRRNIGLGPSTTWDIWVEHELLNQETELQVEIRNLVSATEPTRKKTDVTTGDLSKPFHFETADMQEFINIRILVKGNNPHFRIGNIHLRQSRNGHGEMMIGGNVLIDPDNLESQLLYYFDAGNLKPPLNVYFGGFRPAEGFEAIFMMRGLNAPFLIFSDPRLLGGAFYIGSESLENKVVEVIQKTVKRLGFKSNEITLSGLSMGTFAALYYSSKLQVDWVITGKPLVNLGDIGGNERINRPEQFPTALDLVLGLTGGVDQADIENANQRFWTAFKQQDYSKTGFVFAYMMDDDYDNRAFQQLSRYLHENQPLAVIRHKGIVGRHNDDTPGIVSWMLRQFRDILITNYGQDL